jgi:cytochrome c oxidase subunit 2
VTPNRRELFRMLAIGIGAAALGTFLTLQIDWFPPQAATASKKIDTLYDWLLVASVPMFVLVMAVALYCVVRFRVRPGHEGGDGAPIHGHTRLEIVWVTIPFLIVTALAVYAAVVLAQIEKKHPNELQVHAIGQQFTWHFEYPQPDGKTVTVDQLYLPKDRPAYIRIDTKDVIHSFWVPAFRLKQDTVPGQTTHVRVTPNKEGSYEVVCAELCGWGHSTMRVKAVVLSPDQFNQFIQKQLAPAPQPAAAQPSGGADQIAQGKAIFTGEGGCGACHKLADAGTVGSVGPDLTHVVADALKYGKSRGQSPEAYIRESIENPNAFVVPGYPAGTMPQDYKTGLGPAKIDALVKYLLKAGGGK